MSLELWKWMVRGCGLEGTLCHGFLDHLETEHPLRMRRRSLILSISEYILVAVSEGLPLLLPAFSCEPAFLDVSTNSAVVTQNIIHSALTLSLLNLSLSALEVVPVCARLVKVTISRTMLRLSLCCKFENFRPTMNW